MKNLIVGLVVGAVLATLVASLRNRTEHKSNQPVSAVDGNTTTCTTEQLQHNRQLVRSFFTPKRTPEDAYNMMAVGYIQHNEGVKRFGKINGLNDREGFKAIDDLLTRNAQRPELLEEAGRPKNEMAGTVIATCDYVLAMHRVYVPDPQQQGEYYVANDFELWRIEGGKFAEHWDSQRIPSPVPEFMLKPQSDKPVR